MSRKLFTRIKLSEYDQYLVMVPLQKGGLITQLRCVLGCVKGESLKVLTFDEYGVMRVPNQESLGVTARKDIQMLNWFVERNSSRYQIAGPFMTHALALANQAPLVEKFAKQRSVKTKPAKAKVEPVKKVTDKNKFEEWWELEGKNFIDYRGNRDTNLKQIAELAWRRSLQSINDAPEEKS